MRRESGGGKSAILPERGASSGSSAPLSGAGAPWTEWLAEGAGTTLAGMEPRASVRSAWQHIEIGWHPLFGHVFRLDGRVMSAEADAFIQHEAMVHPMALAHGAPRRALVVGGGDGGSARELARLPGMEAIVLAELDMEVVALARQWLGGIHHGALDDPRIRLRYGDGLQTMASLRDEGEHFDLLVYDLTEADDGSPAAALFSAQGLATAKSCLAPGGVMSMHLGPPFHRPDTARRLLDRLRATFACVGTMIVTIPVYGAPWGIAVASDAVDVARADVTLLGRRQDEWGLSPSLRFYDAALHAALFTLPRHWRDALAIPADPADA